ncbi:enoyl-CoA hydratase/isomerase family protein [Pseudorhodoplanes sp.]|uniref:enoyl-CoA hydratase/isomerase family protein n=1 Tax=Pseudorhodoplanes sp. TaxID=1934341 RepID=UPI003D0FEFDD
MDGRILTERREAVTIVTISAPEVRNAISAQLREQLHETMLALQSDKACRAIVLRGAGGTFCAGGDVRALGSASASSMRDRLMAAHRLIKLLLTSPKPVVAAVDGYAYGAGLSLAVACDLLITQPSAKMCSAFGKVGLIPDLGLLWTLPQKIGAGPAKRMMLTSNPVDGIEAHRIGLADALADEGDVQNLALRQAQHLGDIAPLSVAQTKLALLNAGDDLDRMLQGEIETQLHLLATQDHAEGREAFVQKRKPIFTGR